MKATLQMIADYDGQSKTYGVYLIADEKAVNDSGIEDGDEVEVRKVVTADQPRNRNRAYLAGPMTGHVDYNYPAFNQAAAYYRAMGRDIVSPAELHGQDFGKTFEEYLAVDLAALDTCGTIILLLGWQDSRGAKMELCSAIARGIDVRLCASIMQGKKCKPGKERGLTQRLHRVELETEYGGLWLGVAEGRTDERKRGKASVSSADPYTDKG